MAKTMNFQLHYLSRIKNLNKFPNYKKGLEKMTQESIVREETEWAQKDKKIIRHMKKIRIGKISFTSSDAPRKNLFKP